HLEQENLLLQQRYKELEERVLPLTTSLNGQEYSKEFLKCLYSFQMNPNEINFKLTPNDNTKNSDTIEQLTNLLLYTNISQKDILLNCHQLHKRVAQLEQINSMLCSIICHKGMITALDKNYTNYHPREDNVDSLSSDDVINLNSTKQPCKVKNDPQYCLNQFNKTIHHDCQEYTLPLRNSLLTNDLCVHTTETTEICDMNSLNNIISNDNKNINNSYHPIEYSISNYSMIKQQTNDSNKNNTTQVNHVSQMNSFQFNWLRSKSLPDIKSNLQFTDINILLNESCYRTNSLIKLPNSSSKSLISNYPITICMNKEMMMSSRDLSNYDKNFNISNIPSTSQLTHNVNIQDDLFIDTNKHNIHWLNRPLPKGWIQLQNLPFTKIQHKSTGTHSHIILGTRSLPLICSKSIENRKKTSYTTLLSNDNSLMNSCKYSHSFRNLHVNNVQLNTIIEVDSSPSSFHDSLANKIKYNNEINRSNENSNNVSNTINDDNDINNKDNMESNQYLQQQHEEQTINSIQSPNFFVSPNHSPDFLSTSKQILIRDQKLRYQYPLRSTVISSNHNLLHIPRSYDLETHINYHDTFKKLHNARKNLKFGVFSDTELLTGKFTITSTDDSAIDSGDDDLPSSTDSLYTKTFFITSSNTTQNNFISSNHNTMNNYGLKSNHIKSNHSNHIPKKHLHSLNYEMKISNDEYSNEVDKHNTTEYDSTIQNINPLKANNIHECRKSINDLSEGSFHLSNDLQHCNLKLIAPPPVVIYRRRFQKHTRKKISKLTNHQKSENCKNLKKIKSPLNKTENMMRANSTVNSDELNTEVKFRKRTSPTDNHPNSSMQSVNENLQSNLIALEQRDNVKQKKYAVYNVTTDRQSHISKPGITLSMKAICKLPQTFNGKTPSSSSSSSPSSTSSSITTATSAGYSLQNIKNSTPYFDSTTINMPISSIKSSYSNEVKQNSISKSSNCMLSSMMLKATNNTTKSCISTTLNSCDTRRLRNLSHSPLKASMNYIKNSRVNFTPTPPSSTSSPSITTTLTSSTISKSSPASPYFNSMSNNTYIPLSSILDDSKLMSVEKMSKNLTSVNTSTMMMNTSLKKINKPKINSDKLCRRTLCNNNNNNNSQLIESDKIIPTCTPPPIPPRTTSRSQTYQGKMILLKPKCYSVTNSPIISTQEEIDNSNEYLQYSTKNTLQIHSTSSSSSTSPPSAYINTNVDDVRLNHFSNESNLVSVSLQCKHSIHSKVNSMISTIRKQSIENSILKSSIPSTITTTTTTTPTSSLTSSSSSSLLSSSINPDNLISTSLMYTTNMNELHRNISSANLFDVNNVNKEYNEQVKRYPIDYQSNDYNHLVDNTDLYAQLNATTTITTSIPSIKENNQLIETLHNHHQQHHYDHLPLHHHLHHHQQQRQQQQQSQLQKHSYYSYPHQRHPPHSLYHSQFLQPIEQYTLNNNSMNTNNQKNLQFNIPSSNSLVTKHIQSISTNNKLSPTMLTYAKNNSLLNMPKS
ncbi:hypothetical protein MN116_002581, partial [Schistosoma mekongi]